MPNRARESAAESPLRGGWGVGRSTGGWVWGGWWHTMKHKYCQFHAGPPFRSRWAARRGTGNFSFPGPTPAARCLLLPQPRRLLHPRVKPTASLERPLGNYHSENAIGLAWGCGNLDPCDHSKSGWGPCGGAPWRRRDALPALLGPALLSIKARRLSDNHYPIAAAP